MSNIPEIGSVWASNHNKDGEAEIVWADEWTVVYKTNDRRVDCLRSLNGELGSARDTAETDSFLRNYTPKPRTITINGVELPEPMREAPEGGEEYWFTSTSEQAGVYQTPWCNDHLDTLYLEHGNVFRTKEEAQAWFDFELKLRRGEL